MPVSEARFQYVQRNIERVKVPLGEGQTYASSEDTLPLETFLGSTQNMYISFYQVDSSGAVSLEATVVKGSVITTKAPVSQVVCYKQTASVKYNKANGLASLTLKKSGEVTFNMQDGSTRVVSFFVENPKAQNAAIKKLLGDTSPGGSISLGVEELLGTRLDGGVLSILSQKKDSAVLEGKRLVLTKPAAGSDTVKLRYTYLNKTWNMTITVK